jgi:hypothetical protein
VSDREINRDLLSAYVDGELDPERAAEVMAAVARDPALARELSALTRLKAALGQSVAVPELEIARARPVRGRHYAIAACAALLIAVAAVALSFALFGGAPSADLAWARAAHRSWSGTAAAAGAAVPLPVAGAPAAFVPGAYVPDLAAAKLSVVHVGRARGPAGGAAMVIGYRGTRGCKVSLIVTAGAGRFTRALEAVVLTPYRGFAWRAGRLDYLIVAEGMAQPRLALIARSVRATSLRRLPLDRKTRIALARSRAASPPCRA